jgi:phage shock protein A
VQQERRKEQAKQLEKKITALEAKEGEIEANLADPSVSADYQKVAALCKELEDIKNQIEQLYAEYENYI